MREAIGSQDILSVAFLELRLLTLEVVMGTCAVAARSSRRRGNKHSTGECRRHQALG